jgi:hypothetical protein
MAFSAVLIGLSGRILEKSRQRGRLHHPTGGGRMPHANAMDAVLTHKFLDGHIAARDLEVALHTAGTIPFLDPEDWEEADLDDGRYELVPGSLLKLCDAVIAGAIAPESLSSIARVMVETGYFWYTDELVDDMIWEWSGPDPLTTEVLMRDRERLARAGGGSDSGGSR